MSLASALLLAFTSLRANPLRTLLAMLGIVIGVGAFVTMVAVGTGAQEQVSAQIRSLGTNLIIVLPGTVTAGGVRLNAGSRLTLSEDDAWALMHEVDGVATAGPTLRGTGQIVAGNANWATAILGVTPEYFIARDLEVASGRGLEPDDVAVAAKVALLGPTVAENLFGSEDPIGQMIRVRHVPVQVIGVLEPKGQNVQGQDQDDVVVMPLSTVRKRVLGSGRAKNQNVGTIQVKAATAERMAEIEDGVRALLRQRHRLRPDQGDDFTLRNMTEILEAQQGTARALTFLLATVAAVSLVVGGIGIMNVMLVSVTERTREIGLRMAVGAGRRDVMLQFLLEAATLSALGGVAGAILGIAAAHAIAAPAGWPVVVRPEAVLLALAFAGAVGGFFGFYPARKASLLNPIDALRHA